MLGNLGSEYSSQQQDLSLRLTKRDVSGASSKYSAPVPAQEQPGNAPAETIESMSTTLVEEQTNIDE